MLGVEWSNCEDFTEDLLDRIGVKQQEESMFHGTIDLICSSDEDYDAEISKTDLGQGTSSLTPQTPSPVETEVRDVLNDVVDFVERSLLFPEFGYDPDGRVKEEPFPKEGSACNKPHCSKGCLCSSLRGHFCHGPTHCGRERCIFECTCHDRGGLLTIDDETHYADKSKRKKKIPTRFKDVVLGKDYEKLHAKTILDSLPTDGQDTSDTDEECKMMLTERLKGLSLPSSKAPSPELKRESSGSLSSLKCPLKKSHHDSSWGTTDKASVKKVIQERRVGFVANTFDEDQTLADVFIWCTQHNKYSCLCINYVYFSKTNSLIWKPSKHSRYLAHKVMCDISLKEPTQSSYEVYPYNHNSFSARTYGALLDYNVRNKDEVFVCKRKVELDNGVLSYSNNYVKFKNFLVAKTPHPVFSAEPFDKSLSCNGGSGKLVHLIKTNEKGKVDVGEENLNVFVNYQLDDANGFDDEAKDEASAKTKTRRKRKLTMKMMQLEEERRREREMMMNEESMKEAEELAVQPVRVERKKPGRKPKHMLMLHRSSSDPMERSSFREPTPEVELIKCSSASNVQNQGVRGVEDRPERMDESLPASIKQEPSSPDYFSADSRCDPDEGKEDGIICASDEGKEEAIICAPDVQVVASCEPVRMTMTPHVTTAPSIGMKPRRDDCQAKEFREDIPKPFLGFSDGDNDVEDCDSADDDPDSIHSKNVLILAPRNDGYPHSGLICLTPGLGYISVVECLPGRIVINDPAVPGRKHTFDNIVKINVWLNLYLKNKIKFNPPDLTLQWILVKPGILRFKQAKPFDVKILSDPKIVITPTGLQRPSTDTVSNCTLLRQQLSEQTVFSPVLKKPLAAMREKRSKPPQNNLVQNPKFDASNSNMIPNPKHLLKRMLNRPYDKSNAEGAPLSKIPYTPGRDVSFKSLDRRNVTTRWQTFEKNPHVPSRKHKNPTSSFAGVKPRRSSSSGILPHFVNLPPSDGSQPPSDLELRHQVTIRPLPSLTKITPIQHNKHQPTVKVNK